MKSQRMLNYEVNDSISMKSNFREIVNYFLNLFLIFSIEISKKSDVITLHTKRNDISYTNDYCNGNV